MLPSRRRRNPRQLQVADVREHHIDRRLIYPVAGYCRYKDYSKSEPAFFSCNYVISDILVCMFLRLGFWSLFGAIAVTLATAAEQESNFSIESYTVTVDSPSVPGTIGFTSFSTDLDLQRLNKFVLPEFAVPKPLPLRQILKRLTAEVRRHDQDQAGLTFQIASKAGSASIEDFLILIDPPLTNVHLQDLCKAIAASATAPVNEKRTVQLTFSVLSNTVTFHESERSPDALVSSDPLMSRISSNDPLTVGNSSPLKGIVEIPKPARDRFVVFEPRNGSFKSEPKTFTDLQLEELIPRTRMNPQILLDRAVR